MKKIFQASSLSLVFAVFLLAGCDSNSNKAPNDEKLMTLNTDSDSASYAYGVLIGAQIAEKLEGEKLLSRLDAELFIQGIGKSLGQSVQPYWSLEVADSVMASYYEKVMSQLAEENRAAGEAFLAENGAKAGVTTTESGLQYIVLKEGEGDSPTAADQVKVHYTGKLLNGEVFDSSIERNQPVDFYVRSVIPGWTEALQLMKPGAEYKLFIPSDLAYGEQGNPRGGIGPNEVLIFDVKLIDVMKQ